jgi:hypothetical protein
LSHTENDDPELRQLLAELRRAIYDPKDGILVRLTKMETTLSNLKYLIPLATGITLLIIQLILKAVGLL